MFSKKKLNKREAFFFMQLICGPQFLILTIWYERFRNTYIKYLEFSMVSNHLEILKNRLKKSLNDFFWMVSNGLLIWVMDSLDQTVCNFRRFGSNSLDFVIFFSYLNLFIIIIFWSGFIYLAGFIFRPNQAKKKCHRVDQQQRRRPNLAGNTQIKSSHINPIKSPDAWFTRKKPHSFMRNPLLASWGHGFDGFQGRQGEGLGLIDVDLFSGDEHETDLGANVEELEGAVIVGEDRWRRSLSPLDFLRAICVCLGIRSTQFKTWRVRVLYLFVYNALNIRSVILVGKCFSFQKKRTVVILV